MNNLTQKGQQLRSTNRPIYGASTITVNNTIYIYGGFYNVAPWNKEALWQLSNTMDDLYQIETDPYASPAVIYHTLENIDHQTIYSFGGHLTTHDILTPPAENATYEFLRYYRFNLDQSKWTSLQKKNGSVADVPLERFWHTTAQFNGTVYLYGGLNITHGGFLDFWKYNPVIDRWMQLNQQEARCGHTSTMTDDGKMINLGGFDCKYASFLSPKEKPLYSFTSATIFDSKTTQWYQQPLTGIIPASRTFHTAIKSNGNSIIICGGQNHAKEPFQNYMSGTQMTAILDLNSWEWQSVLSSVHQPFPSSFSISTLVNDTKMVYGLGLNGHTVYDGFYVFDIQQRTWIPTESSIIDETNIFIQQQTHKVSLYIVLAISILGSILGLCIIVCCLWHKYRIFFINHIKSVIWSPRAGEPFWAEISRLLFRLWFFAVFSVISCVLILQVKQSPIIHQTHRENNREMMTPDIRFCFDGWVDQARPVLQCTTDFGRSCDKYLMNITQQVNKELDYYGSQLDCYLFLGGEQMKLGSQRLSNYGTKLHFYYYGQSANQSALHVEFYHPLHDPNIPTYGIDSKGSFDEWYSPDEYAKFVSGEKMNLKTKNVYSLDPAKISQVGYTYKRIERVDPSILNYIGFKSYRDTVHEVETVKKHQVKETTTANKNGFLGALYVFPSSQDTIVMREQRAFTVVHGIGIIGGILGLLIGLQTNVFGYRPRSPWGIIHRWSIGLMTRSLLDGLRKRFSSGEVYIPIVQPVHRRFSEKDTMDDQTLHEETEEERTLRLEQRLHVFEYLFQAYYINDEIFRSCSSSSSSTRSSCNKSTTTAKNIV